MVTIKRGFSVQDVNNYKIVTEKKTQEENGKKVVSKLKKVTYQNPKLVTIGYVKRLTCDNAPEVLKNQEIFEIPNPFNVNKKEEEDGRFHNIDWNLEQALLAVKEGYADGFFTSYGLFGNHTAAFKVVDPVQAPKVRNYFLKDFKEWFKLIEENPFSYVATITTSMSTFEIGTSNEPTEKIGVKENIDKIIKFLKEWDSEKSEDYKPDDFDKGSYEARAARLLELFYYKRNTTNIWGQKLANDLEFETFEEALEKSTWLRRHNGGYSGAEFINNGAELVNHGFRIGWQSKKLTLITQELL